MKLLLNAQHIVSHLSVIIYENCFSGTLEEMQLSFIGFYCSMLSYHM